MSRINIFHNSRDSFYRTPFGAVECDDKVVIRLAVDTQLNIDCAKFVISQNESKNYIDMQLESFDKNKRVYKCFFKVSENPMLIFYYFEINSQDGRIYYGNNKLGTGGIGEVYMDSPLSYQITVFKKGYETANWFKNAIIYQIFVDRFYNGNENGVVLNPKKNSFIYGDWYDKPMYIKDPKSNEIIRWDFYGGNLKGIIEKLDYLCNMGISLIYLNPVFEARSNHKYDTGNYKKIDPMFGDEKVFKELIKKAKEKGIEIILDGVFNHTGADSIYFNKFNSYDSIGAYQSKDSKYYDWYSFDNHPDKYECWWGVEDLPNVKEMDNSYINYILRDDDSVIKHWMKAGIKGWRLDVADELPDEFIREIKKTCINIDSDSILIGEVWEDASNKISYDKRREYFYGYELDSATNYPFRDNILNFFAHKINAKALYESFMSLYENYPRHNFYSMVNLIGSHDVERILSVLKEITIKNYFDKCDSPYTLEELTFRLLKIITLIQFTFPGVPLIYYGDEAGLEGLKDPYNRATYPWGKENKEILNWYKDIINIRNKNIILRTGKWEPLYFMEDVYGYIRYIKDSKDEFNNTCENAVAIILINRNPKEGFNVPINVNSDMVLTNALCDNDTINLSCKTEIEICPLEGKVYIG